MMEFSGTITFVLLEYFINDHFEIKAAQCNNQVETT